MLNWFAVPSIQTTRILPEEGHPHPLVFLRVDCTGMVERKVTKLSAALLRDEEDWVSSENDGEHLRAEAVPKESAPRPS
jgi:hypothetical protein